MIGKVEVNDPSAAALASPGQTHPRFPKPSCSLNNVTFFGIFNEFVLESAIILIANQRGDDGREARKFDEFQGRIYVTLYHFSRACRDGLSQRNDSPVSGKRHDLFLVVL